MAFHHLLFCLDPQHLFCCCIRGNKSNIRNIHNDTPNHPRHFCISFECQNRNIPILHRNYCKLCGVVGGYRLLLLPYLFLLYVFYSRQKTNICNHNQKKIPKQF